MSITMHRLGAEKMVILERQSVLFTNNQDETALGDRHTELDTIKCVTFKQSMMHVYFQLYPPSTP